MAKNNFYPSPAITGQLHDTFRLLFDGLYQNQDKLRELEGKTAKGPAKENAKGSPTPSNGPSNSKLNGLFVKAVPPQHGMSPAYNSTTGQWEPATAAGAVKPPATSSAPGIAGQIAFDGSFVYVHVGTGWKRATLTTF